MVATGLGDEATGSVASSGRKSSVRVRTDQLGVWATFGIKEVAVVEVLQRGELSMLGFTAIREARTSSDEWAWQEMTTSMTLASLILVRNVASLPQCRNAAAAAFRSPASSHATIASPSFCSNRDSEDMDGASSLRPFPVHHTNLRNLEGGNGSTTGAETDDDGGDGSMGFFLTSYDEVWVAKRCSAYFIGARSTPRWLGISALVRMHCHCDLPDLPSFHAIFSSLSVRSRYDPQASRIMKPSPIPWGVVFAIAYLDLHLTDLARVPRQHHL
uniref:Uncharacterized protein n=1 Tax=Oryza sativa subsp. japonica TaxID=39947 RepID=Q6ZCQ0_ORYSJ|nr:hypothetical protein [Oryza sativa Japonica Group]